MDDIIFRDFLKDTECERFLSCGFCKKESEEYTVYITKNRKLIGLCNECYDKVSKGEIEI